MSADKILSIDLGTSGPKVALFDVAGALIDHDFEPVELLLFDGGGACQRPRDWTRAIIESCSRMLDRQERARGEVTVVACTAQWSGTVVIDEACEPLGDAIIWMDSRGAPQVQEVACGWPRVAGYNVMRLWPWIRRTGGIPTLSGKDSIAHILFLKAHEPERFRDAHLFIEPKDYLNAWLTGRAATTPCAIALHWLADIRDLSHVGYDPKLLDYVGIPREKFPPIISSIDEVGTVRAEIAQALRIPSTARVIGGTPDVQSAALGSGAVADYNTHLYIGTSSWLSCHLPFKKTSIAGNMASLPSAIPGRYFVANAQETAGKCVDYFIDRILAPPSEERDLAYSQLEELAATAAPGCDGLIFLPWLYGERTPVDDSTIRGGFFNLSLDNSRADMARAVLEGVAYNSRWVLEHLERFIGRPVEEITMVGGGAESSLWCQIHADLLNRPVLRPELPRMANLRGAAHLGAVALGACGFDDLQAHTPITERYEPRAEYRSRYTALFPEFKALYTSTRGICKRLNRRSL